MAKKKSKYLLDPKHPLRTLVYILIALGFLIGGYFTLNATQTSTESRSKAAETEIVVDSWEFNGTTKEGWVQTNLTSGSVKNGTLYFGVMSANKPSSVTQNTVDGPFANIILQKLKFSLKVNDPPSKLRPSPTPSGKPFTGEVRYMTAGKTTWEAPQPFNGVIDNQFKTYEVLLAGLPDVDITKIQITFKLLPNSTGLTFDWIKLTGQPKPTPTPTSVPAFGKALRFNNDGNNDTYIFSKPGEILSRNPFTVETWVKIPKPLFSGSYLRVYPILQQIKPQSFLDNGYIFKLNAEVQEGSGKWRPSFQALLKDWTDALNRHLAYITVGNYVRSLEPDAWYHLAVVSYSEGDHCYLQLYINGVLEESSDRFKKDCQISTMQGQDLVVGKPTQGEGGISGYYFTGDLDELRISTTRRYTVNFTPQAKPFSNDLFTRVLYHLDEGSNGVRDYSDYFNDARVSGSNLEFVQSTISQ